MNLQYKSTSVSKSNLEEVIINLHLEIKPNHIYKVIIILFSNFKLIFSQLHNKLIKFRTICILLMLFVNIINKQNCYLLFIYMFINCYYGDLPFLYSRYVNYYEVTNVFLSIRTIPWI